MRDLCRDYQVIGLDLKGDPHPPREAECATLDLTDDDSVRAVLQRIDYAYGPRIAAVVHLAAFVDFSAEDSPMYGKVTVRGTKRLLEQMHDHGFLCERFIFSSTMLVHRPTRPGEPINEHSPIEPKWGYPRSKVEAEEAIREHAGDVPFAFLRIAGVYTDEGQAPTIAHQLKRIHERDLQSRVFPGDPSHGQSFVHIEDTVSAIRAAVDRRIDLPKQAVYLIGEPETYSYEQLQDAMGECLHGKAEWKTIRVPEAMAEVGASVQERASVAPGVDEPFIKPFMVEMADDHYELDISRAQRDLGWSPEHRLIDAIPRMCEALKGDPDAWYAAHQMKG